MTGFQKVVVGLLGVLVIAVCVFVAFHLSDRFTPSYEEQLAKACDENPLECERMRMVHSQTEAAIRQAQTYGPGMADSIAELRRVQKEYDDRFIAEGYYGDPR
ncbi:MAG: hypothetical protein MK104_07670 [Erythrobacter sp.]|jgi:hypothetical protein|uniref:hypothetical protein n=1 Tax=Qipengyuania pacifica TaxID=2860199 RepID=UPI0035C78C95|nr:hypothetical protein [Erythrobacter sp.]